MTTAADKAVRQDEPSATTPTRKRIQANIPGFWTVAQFAEAFGITVDSANRWWKRRYGPRRIPIGGSGIRATHSVYKISECLAWLDEQGQPPARRRRRS
jgi:hypothetical protein